ncbi:MAG: protein SacC2 [Verrucomicrobia bacterium]|nr:protein SacC2 [Verrucomicrobiota bacterium]
MKKPTGAEAPTDWRPRFHFTAPTGWINDPNGLVRVDDSWHLHYQYEWPRQWGHATSRDLFAWKHEAVALQPDKHGDCWSGGTVDDRRNTSGIFSRGTGGLVSIYTSQDEANGQRLSLASSADGGGTWVKFPGNPILRRSTRECRDPKVFRDEARDRWVMVLTESRFVTFLVSMNLRDWRETGRFTPQLTAGAAGVECPDLFQLPVENRPGASKWVLVMSYLGGENFAGNFGFGVCAQRYFVGEFDGDTFTAEQGADALLPFGSGPDEYAAIVWPREAAEPRRTVAIGWMNHWGYSKQIPTAPWQGCLTLPRELTLHQVAEEKWEIRQVPARELWAKLPRREKFATGALWGSDAIKPLGKLRSGAIRAHLSPSPGSVLEFELFADQLHRTVVGYDAARELLYFDRRDSGSPDFHPNFPARHEVKLPLRGGSRLEIMIVIDVSSVEVFASDGAVYLSGLTFPRPEAAAANLKVCGGRVMIEELEVLS